MNQLDRIERKLDKVLEGRELQPRCMSMTAAARYLGVSLRSINRLIGEGHLGYTQLHPNGAKLILIEEIDALIDDNRRRAESDDEFVDRILADLR